MSVLDDEDHERFYEEQEHIEFLVEEIKAETLKAWLMVIEGDEYWLPKSQCTYNKKTSTVDIPEWLAKEKGLY